ncbi:lipoprotein-releasing ABC transporter permease subunit LolE [Moritella yayanosii]|uniref:Outer membrane-specific lipoprotein transporter subunit membrane component of ABC superfamily n=1 Tax=Moritella yayanosii TaxID=69539 RepID=A0A330LJR0_9GAMM|nr:lipoprotein-releasing ABC transporter permease subunit LolE [Moritella yayanosii]SQD77357.1 outer membrane-specific lipoprotein transporter subunit; membrane component of ABC superfamily [Moritella yayanosii]
MFRPLAAYIGLRYTSSKRRNGFIAFISASSTIGIALGVMVLIIGLSAMNGFEYELKNRILAVVPNGELEGVSQPFDDWQRTQAQLLAHPEVVGAAPFIKLNGLLQKGNELKAVQLRAVDSEAEKQVSEVYRYVAEGSWDSLSDPTNNRTVVIGRGIAKELNLELGDPVTVLLSQQSGRSFKAPRRFRFTVSGIIHLSGQLDNNLAYIPLSAAQEIQDKAFKADGMSIKVTDIFSANRIVREAGNQLDHYLYIRSWMTSQGFLYQDIQMVKSLMYVILTLVIAVACFNIVTTLVMAVNDKRADIAILKTMGASNTLLRLIFIVHGGINGILGVVSGTVLGILISENLTVIIQFIEGLIGQEFLSGDIYFIDFLPSQLALNDVLAVGSAAMIMSVIATIYPANKACSVQPAHELGNK